MNTLFSTGAWLGAALGQGSSLEGLQAVQKQLGLYYAEFIAQLIGFSILLFVLHRYAYKPVLEVLEQRRLKVAQSVENADKIKRQLEEAALDHKRIIAEAHEKAAKTLAEAQKASETQSQQKLQETVAQVEALIKKSQEAMALERDKMISEVRREMARLVVATSGKVIGRNLTPEDQTRLQAEAARELSN